MNDIMGFKCPNCKKDFGTSKLLWQEHVKTCGLAQNMVEIYTSKTKEDVLKNLTIIKNSINTEVKKIINEENK